MLISKNHDNVINSDIVVDNWEVRYEENPMTGDLSLNEKISGLTKIEQTDIQMYLGFVILSTI